MNIATQQLRTIWRRIVSTGYGKNAALPKIAANAANASGATPGTANWYATAIWFYSQA